MAACFVLAVVGAYLLGCCISEEAERWDEAVLAPYSSEAVRGLGVASLFAVVIGLGGFIAMQAAGLAG